MSNSNRHGTRIFKKATPNGKLTVYLGKRVFVDRLSYVDPIEGVVLLDPEYVKDRKVFVHLLCAFRHGREENDFLNVRDTHRNLFLKTKQVFPPVTSQPRGFRDAVSEFGFETARNQDNEIVPTSLTDDADTDMTRLQERLVRKLGPNTYPFSFKLPPYTPASVTLLLPSSETGKPCRVDYELKVYVAEDEDSRPQKRSSVRMVIRKLTFAPEEPGPQPSAEISRDFLMSIGSLRIEATLDKQKYYHGESIVVNVLVDNNSTKTVKRIRLTVRQFTHVCLPNSNEYKCNVAEILSEEGFPISPSQTGWCKVYRLCPLLDSNREKLGLALDGDLKNEDTNLASSTIVPPKFSRDVMGIVVQYKVKVRLCLGFGLSDACLELPFILTHPNSNVENGDLSDEQLDLQSEWQTSHHSDLFAGPIPNNSRLNGGGGGREGNGVGHPLEPAVLAAPQMGVLARTINRAPSTPSVPVSTSHIVEFRRASDMPDGMDAFSVVQQPQSKQPVKTAPFALCGAELNLSRAIVPLRERLPLFMEKQPTEYALPTNSTQQPTLTPIAQFVTPQESIHFGNKHLNHPDFHSPRSVAVSSTESQDDLIFEDFARLRLKSQQQRQQNLQLVKPH